jgi:NhaB family Na+:H+ antiporter
MLLSLAGGAFKNFMGNSPVWYKQLILLFLVINPLCYWALGGE